MKYFERDSKYNFVDANNVFVGYDSEQNCCESAGWYISYSPAANAIEVSESVAVDLEPYSFYPDYFREDAEGESSIAEFKLKAAGLPDLYLILYNAHNGYYGHGFKCTISGETLRSGIL